MPNTSKRKQDEQNDDHHHHLQQRVVSKKKKRERPDDIEDYMASSSTGSKRRKKDEQSSPFDLDNVIKSDTDDTNLLSESQSSSSYGEIDSDSSVTKTMIEEEYHRYSDSDENQQQQQRISNNNKGKQFGRGCVSIRTKKKESRKRQRKKLDDSEEDSINGGFDDGQQYSDEQRERALVLATPSSSSSSRGRSMITVPNIFDQDNGNLQHFLNRGRQRNSDGGDDDDENNNNLNNFDDDDDDSGSQCEEDHNLNDGDDDDDGSSGNRGEEELWKRTTSPFLTEVEKTLGPLIEGEECPGCMYVNPTDHRCEKNWVEFNKIYITETPWRDPKEVAIQQYNFYENRLRMRNKKLPKWSPRMIFEHNWKHVTDDAIFNMQCKIRFQNIMREFLDQGSYITNGKMVAFDGSKEVLSTLKTLDDLYQRRCKLANKDAMQNGVSVKTVIHQDGIKNTSSFL